jgi:hypothetical protein
MSRVAFYPVHNLAWGECGRKRTEQVDVIGLNDKLDYFPAKLDSLGTNQRIKSGGDAVNQDGTTEFRYPNEVIMDVVRGVSRSFALHKRIIANLFCSCKHKATARSAAHIPLPAEAGSTL